MEKRYQVFISSTFVDLEEERKEVMEAIINLNCFPAGMEMFPATDTEQFEYIKSVIDESDYYVIIVAGKYGSVAEDGISYTEKEFDYAYEKKIPILAFIKKDIENIPGTKIENDPKKKKKLQEFRKKICDGRLAKFWDTPDELKYKLHSSLSNEFKIHPRAGWIRGNSENDGEMLSLLTNLRIENEDLKASNIEKNLELTLDKRLNKEFSIEYSIDEEDDNYDIFDLSCSDILINMGVKMINTISRNEFAEYVMDKIIDPDFDRETEYWAISEDSVDDMLMHLAALKIIDDYDFKNIQLTESGKQILYNIMSF